MTRWWLSFSDALNLGACIVEAPSFPEAVREAHRLGINPGGEVCGVEVPDTDEARDDVARFGMNRLIPRDELLAGGCVVAS